MYLKVGINTVTGNMKWCLVSREWGLGSISHVGEGIIIMPYTRVYESKIKVC